MSESTLDWSCDKCHRRITDGDGYIHVSHSEIAQFEDAFRAWEREHKDQQIKSLSDLDSMPELVSWHAHHLDCDPEPMGNDYSIDVARVRSFKQVLDLTLHLSQKTWFNSTDWGSFVRARFRELNGAA